MDRRLPSAWPWALVGCVVLGPAWSMARAADVETRDFNVFVDGKRAGAAHITIQNADDATIGVSCDTDVTVPGLFVTYKYSYRGHEVWKDGKLLRFESNCNDDGKRYVVSAAAEDKGIRFKVNNQERIVSHNVWLTSYWARPDNKVVNQTIPLVDADTGRDLDAKVTYVGQEDVMISGQSQTLLHYKLTGKVQIDLWYDGADRIARQEFVEDGHKTIVELTKIRK
jgi:Family of unknown function (DUF6134)